MAPAEQTGNIHLRCGVLHRDNFLVQFKTGHPAAFETHATAGFGAEDDANTLVFFGLGNQAQADHLSGMNAGL